MTTPVKRVYLIGFMGSGKSTAGKKLAGKLGWDFIDLDAEIEKNEGRPVRRIFSEKGEDYFRELESKTLRNLQTLKDSVISSGGGTPCFLNNLEFMKQTGKVVYLKMKPSQLKKRLEQGIEERPLLKEKSGDELVKYITKILAEREKFYLDADLIVDGMSLDINDLCKKLI
jgi:shikimate kinase